MSTDYDTNILVPCRLKLCEVKAGWTHINQKGMFEYLLWYSFLQQFCRLLHLAEFVATEEWTRMNSGQLLRGLHVGQSELIYLLLFEMQVFYAIQSSIILKVFNSYYQKPYNKHIALPFMCLQSSKRASVQHVCLRRERVPSSIQSSLCYLRVSTPESFRGGS